MPGSVTRFTFAATLVALAAGSAFAAPGCSGDPATRPPEPPEAGVTGPTGRLRVDAPAELRTRETGERATFTVALGARPAEVVTVPITSSNEREITAEPTALTFTPDDWDRPKTVTLTGRDDAVADGDQAVEIGLGPVSSMDGVYNALRAAPLRAVNADDDTPGVEVSAPSPNAVTNETGTKVTFSVRLRSQPTGDVTIPLGSSKPGEGTPDKTSLVFTAANWSTPQTVTVTGKDDAVADGDQKYAVELGRCLSADATYAVIDPPDVSLTNEDDDIPGFFVTPAAPAAKTTEAGGKATFTVRLRSRPTDQVTIPVASTNAAEGTPDVGALAFTPADYDQPRTITVTGKDDAIDDGDVAYAIALSPALSADAAYAGLDPPDVALVNEDDDTAGILVSVPAPSNQTTEAGGKVTFTVRLASEPTATVTVGVSSNKPLEGTPDVTELVFGPGDWSAPKTVTVTGQNDAIDDGNVAYAIVLAKAVSADAKYAAIDPPDVALVNVDDDTAGISVGAPQPSAVTTEAGGKVTVSVVLQSQPTAQVTIPVSVSKPLEAQVDVASLVFDAADWNQAKTITVTGKDDAIDDGDQAYLLVLGAVVSADANYGGRNPADIALTNTDDDTAGMIVSAPAPSSSTTETGGQVTFTVRLASQPLSDVNVPIASTKTTEGKVDKASLTFSSLTWSIPQTVTVTGQPDNVDDGDQAYAVNVGATTSGDPLYVGRTASISLVNVDACGNGATDPGEQCDDANGAKCDGCESCERRRWLALPAGASATVAGITAALPRGNMCVEAWAKVGPPASGDAVIASSFGAANNGAFLLRCQDAGAVTGRLVFANDNGGALLESVATGTGCSDGAWHHFAGCRAVAAGTITLTVFLDGVLRATAMGPDTTLGANAALVFGGTTYVTEGLVGAIDEVRISNVVRYGANFTPARRLAADGSTVALYHLDEGSGTTFADASGNGYGGTLSPTATWEVDTGYTAAMCQ